ncbi:response regulator receiver domain-containing protein [Motilibacter rhizosphaerae]|uniref:Response regulator receiver domain-containing protein n=1 Tax=Motilibacter rhizosphaerae TaxID=598652 RepID=A0A4Q7NT11_9ACTN|nr:response regulator [Motilibacter rhizosphaerae]RZS89928.1 response regulator receiver domain-containing protein [Motilibacter rhizosphaerae]
MARVLVVEDDPDVRFLLAAQLRRADHEARCVASGEEAVALLASGPAPEVAIVDVGLPGADGFSVLDSLARAGLRAERVVMVTASPAVQLADRVRAQGARYLAKPYAAVDLLQVVAQALAQTQALG